MFYILGTASAVLCHTFMLQNIVKWNRNYVTISNNVEDLNCACSYLKRKVQSHVYKGFVDVPSASWVIMLITGVHRIEEFLQNVLKQQHL
jgi:hypothetical protein